MTPRWDGDDRGVGVGNAGQLVSGARELLAVFEDQTWVAEQPEVHLLPHIAGWIQQDQRLAMTGARTDGTAFVLDLQWLGRTGGVGAARAAVYALIGSFAEEATYIRQRRLIDHGDPSATRLQFEVGTGELAADTRFKSHGHVVLIDVAGAF